MNSAKELRQSGILLPLSALPEEGRLGQAAYRFVDLLHQAGQSIWQLLPVGPTMDGSPYNSQSAHAGEPHFIDPQLISQWTWAKEIPGSEYKKDKTAHIKNIKDCFQYASAREQEQYQSFIHSNRYWLEDYALYTSLKEKFGQSTWLNWPRKYRDREALALEKIKTQLHEKIEQIKFEQYLFRKQWLLLKSYANKRGIALFGDVPFYVCHDSADVWCYRDCFKLNVRGRPDFVAGVPPDYFSKKGQCWNTPVYNWEKMAESNYQWWQDRIKSNSNLFDKIRLDHFCGFHRGWEIKNGYKTGRKGKWVIAPGQGLLDKIFQIADKQSFVAEDLGLVVDALVQLRDKNNLMGMKVVQFAFDSNKDNPHLVQHHEPNNVVYTGTHDNDTTIGWFDSLSKKQQKQVDKAMLLANEAMPWSLMRYAMSSVARICIIPMQDVLSLGSDSRTNIPGTSSGNWQWQFEWEQIEQGTLGKLRELATSYGRASGTEF